MPELHLAQLSSKARPVRNRKHADKSSQDHGVVLHTWGPSLGMHTEGGVPIPSAAEPRGQFRKEGHQPREGHQATHASEASTATYPHARGPTQHTTRAQCKTSARNLARQRTATARQAWASTHAFDLPAAGLCNEPLRCVSSKSKRGWSVCASLSALLAWPLLILAGHWEGHSHCRRRGDDRKHQPDIGPHHRGTQEASRMTNSTPSLTEQKLRLSVSICAECTTAYGLASNC